ncbi:hypothetical protein B0H16DRAFT_1688886 [Mycena metata]|uniref:Uncharacterized protein n=1 Tax=Mycena metata TaxID=1033252 RepID=A0AAD7JCX2_9AGAR|nr:hypothetical protein B0H16DRAFT_1688886 [Mycena metata]
MGTRASGGDGKRDGDYAGEAMSGVQRKEGRGGQSGGVEEQHYPRAPIPHRRTAICVRERGEGGEKEGIKSRKRVRRAPHRDVRMYGCVRDMRTGWQRPLEWRHKFAVSFGFAGVGRSGAFGQSIREEKQSKGWAEGEEKHVVGAAEKKRDRAAVYHTYVRSTTDSAPETLPGPNGVLRRRNANAEFILPETMQPEPQQLGNFLSFERRSSRLAFTAPRKLVWSCVHVNLPPPPPEKTKDSSGKTNSPLAILTPGDSKAAPSVCRPRARSPSDADFPSLLRASNRNGSRTRNPNETACRLPSLLLGLLKAQHSRSKLQLQPKLPAQSKAKPGAPAQSSSAFRSKLTGHGWWPHDCEAMATRYLKTLDSSILIRKLRTFKVKETYPYRAGVLGTTRNRASRKLLIDNGPAKQHNTRQPQARFDLIRALAKFKLEVYPPQWSGVEAAAASVLRAYIEARERIFSTVCLTKFNASDRETSATQSQSMRMKIIVKDIYRYNPLHIHRFSPNFMPMPQLQFFDLVGVAKLGIKLGSNDKSGPKLESRVPRQLLPFEFRVGREVGRKNPTTVEQKHSTSQKKHPKRYGELATVEQYLNDHTGNVDRRNSREDERDTEIAAMFLNHRSSSFNWVTSGGRGKNYGIKAWRSVQATVAFSFGGGYIAL